MDRCLQVHEGALVLPIRMCFILLLTGSEVSISEYVFIGFNQFLPAAGHTQ